MQSTSRSVSAGPLNLNVEEFPAIGSSISQTAATTAMARAGSSELAAESAPLASKSTMRATSWSGRVRSASGTYAERVAAGHTASSVDSHHSGGSNHTMVERRFRELLNMFPTVSQNVVRDVFEQCERDVSKACNYLLEVSGNTKTLLPHTASLSSHARPTFSVSTQFGRLGHDVLHIITGFLSLHELVRASAAGRELKVLVDDVIGSITQVNASSHPFRHWPDRLILSMLARFPVVTHVILNKCVNFSSFLLIPSALQTSLCTTLLLSGCVQLSDRDVDTLFIGLPALQVVDLSFTSISDEALERILLRSHHLQKLNLAGCTSLTDFGVLTFINRIRTLERLDLRSTKLTKRFLRLTEPGSILSQLLLSQCGSISSVNLPNEFWVIRDLQLSSMSNLQDVSIDSPTLVFLNLSNSKQLKTTRIDAPSLHVLNISGCKSLQSISGRVSALDTVNMYNCYGLDVASLTFIFRRNRTTLKQVNACGLWQLTDEVLLNLIEGCWQLYELDISGCKNITNVGTNVALGMIQGNIERRRQGA